MILAVDPGRICGWAFFSETDGECITAGFVRKPELVPRVDGTLVIERPHGGAGKASRTDLVVLARRMQSVIDAVRAWRVAEVAPNRWKGTTEKSIMTRRIRERWLCDPADPVGSQDRWVLGIVETNTPSSYFHNVLDAYGLGRWYLAALGIREIPCR
jgi:hypothetical protein